MTLNAIGFGVIGYTFGRFRGLDHASSLQRAWSSAKVGAILAIPYVGPLFGLYLLYELTGAALRGDLNGLDYGEVAAYVIMAVVLRRVHAPVARQVGVKAVEPSVRVFRVEGKENTRLIIDKDGNVGIIGDGMIFLNFGRLARAIEFFKRRTGQNLTDPQMKSFEVPQSVLDALRREAVPENLAREFPEKPIVVDVTKAADQYGLREPQIKWLADEIIQGTGKSETPSVE